MTSFQIADVPTSIATVQADKAGTPVRQGKLSLTVRNISDKAQTARVEVEASGEAKPDWFSIEGAPPTGPRFLERDFAAGSTQTVSVLIAVPPDAVPNTYSFRVKATAEADPDNDFATGPSVSLVVPPLTVKPPSKPFPWWAVAVAAVFLILVAGGAAFFLWPKPPQLVEVVGQTPAAARTLLETAGFKPADITDETGPAVGRDPGTVAEARLSGGGFKVALVVDPGVPVPAVQGQTLANAQQAIIDAELSPRVVLTPNGTVTTNVADVVNPAPGTPVKWHGVVDIVSYIPQPSGGGGGPFDPCIRIRDCVVIPFEQLEPVLRRDDLILTPGIVNPGVVINPGVVGPGP